MASVVDVFVSEIRDGVHDFNCFTFEVPPYFVPFPLYDADVIAETLAARLEGEGYSAERVVEERIAGDRDWDLWPKRHASPSCRDNVMPFAFDESQYVVALAARRQILKVTVPSHAIRISTSLPCRFCGK